MQSLEYPNATSICRTHVTRHSHRIITLIFSPAFTNLPYRYPSESHHTVPYRPNHGHESACNRPYLVSSRSTTRYVPYLYLIPVTISSHHFNITHARYVFATAGVCIVYTLLPCQQAFIHSSTYIPCMCNQVPSKHLCRATGSWSYLMVSGDHAR